MNIPALNRGIRLEMLLVLLFTLVNCAKPTVESELKPTTEEPNKLLTQTQETHLLLDFEQSPLPLNSEPLIKNPGLTTVIGPTTGSTFEPPVVRTSSNPKAGLWCAETLVQEGHRLNYRCPKPLDLRKYDTFAVQAMQSGTPALNGHVTAAVYLEDASGKRVIGEAYPITNNWQEIPIDLKAFGVAPLPVITTLGGTESIALNQIVLVGLELKRAEEEVNSAAGITGADATASPPPPVAVTVRTDSWQVSVNHRVYTGPHLGSRNTFLVQQDGLRLQVGQVDRFELIFHQRAARGPDSPWLEVRQGKDHKLVLGEPGTGLFLLDQDQLEAINPILSKSDTPMTTANTKVNSQGSILQQAPVLWTWKVLWVSPQAAWVEVLESIGPYDRLGRGRVERTWRLMIYQTGQVYLQITPTSPHTSISPPVSPDQPETANPTGNKESTVTAGEPLALVLGIGTEHIQAMVPQPNRLLKAIYPAALQLEFKNEVDGAEENRMVLPHEYQVGYPVAMAGKWFAQEKLWFHAQGPTKGQMISNQPCTYVGQGIPQPLRGGPWCAMLLVNSPQALDQATGFASFLSPPKLEVKLGEQDRHFPGDQNNDGMVDGTGFMPVQMTGQGTGGGGPGGAGGSEIGRASWTVMTGNRPIYYPAFLITPPPTAFTPPNSTPAQVQTQMPAKEKRTLLINIDGQQILNPPQWADGSGYLVQLPWIISNPVHIEVEWAAGKPPTMP